MADQVFWRRKTLEQMTPAEWESLCDGCGKCCVHKLEDEDSGEIHYTTIACAYLDEQTCRCRDYSHRQQQVPHCVVLRPEEVSALTWLPQSCAYRLIAAGKPLADWHPLMSGDPDSVHRAGMSVTGKVISEALVSEDDWQDYIVRWV